MAYVTGSATSMADLLTALQTACTGNGWTLSGNVLSKGTCYASVTVSGSVMSIFGGTGIDGSNALTGGYAYDAQMRYLAGQAITWPATYEIFIASDPDEVYVVLQHNVTRYLWLGWGQSPAAGIPGTGNWYAASAGHDSSSSTIAIAPVGMHPVGVPTFSVPGIGFITQIDGITANAQNPVNFFAQHGLDSNAWSAEGSNGAGSLPNDYFNNRPSVACCAPYLDPLLSRQPNAWNGESVLLPIQMYVDRGSSKRSMVSELGHARHVRIDNIDPGQIITLGSDSWKVYPWYQKNAAERDGTTGGTHTGTLGWAVRYDGP